MDEKRKSLRMEMEAIIKLNEVKTKKTTADMIKDEFEVKILNVSTGGIAFITEKELRINTYYDLHMILSTMAAFDTVIEIVRMESLGENGILYGCKFVGLRPSQELEIQICEALQGIE